MPRKVNLKPNEISKLKSVFSRADNVKLYFVHAKLDPELYKYITVETKTREYEITVNDVKEWNTVIVTIRQMLNEKGFKRVLYIPSDPQFYEEYRKAK